jgi:hypothetical protein
MPHKECKTISLICYYLAFVLTLYPYNTSNSLYCYKNISFFPIDKLQQPFSNLFHIIVIIDSFLISQGQTYSKDRGAKSQV